MPVASRVGRDKQRYDGETGGRMVAGCVLFWSFFFEEHFVDLRPRLSVSLSLSFLTSCSSSSSSSSSSSFPLLHRTVPFRVISGDKDDDGDDDESNSGNNSSTKLTLENVRILLVTSRSGAGLVFPKGGWETDESCEAAAARETVEEAGVRGDLEPVSLGTFRFASSKKKKKKEEEENGNGGSAATMFALRVREQLPEWPESAQRCRVWLRPGDALASCKHAWMREALGVWAARHGIGGGGGGGEEEEARNGNADDAGPPSTSTSNCLPLLPSPGGKERAAAAAVEAARAAGLAVVPWIKIDSGEEGEEEGEDKGGGTEGAKAAEATTAAK